MKANRASWYSGARLVAAALAAAAAWGQVASEANKNYRTEEGRAALERGLGNPARIATQKPDEVVAALGIKPGATVADVGTGVGFMLPYLKRKVGRRTPARFRLFPFARRYSGSRCCFSFLRVLRCFSSPGSPYRPYIFRPEYRRFSQRWVSPIGHPRINAREQLPVAFRSHPRPSSALGAKASTVGFCSLENKMLVLTMQFSKER